MSKIYFAVAAGVLAMSTPALAQSQSGVRVEGRLGYEIPTINNDGDSYKIGNAATFGGEVGYDLDLGSVAVGPYALYESSSVKLCDASNCLKEDGTWGVGGRVGVAVSPALQLYGKLGYSKIKFTISNATAKASGSKGGVQGGIGATYTFGSRAYGLLEFNYAGYSSDTDSTLRRAQFATGIGYRF